MGHADLASRATAPWRLLGHWLYRAWGNGTLPAGQLRTYAEQYRYVETALPSVLRTIRAALPPGAARDAVHANLADELGNPAPHTELFMSFASAAGARPGVPPAPATTRLTGLQLAAAASPAAGLAVLAAYETQAGEVAAVKARALREHYGMDAQATRFWDVHAEMEASHADWTMEAISALDPDLELVAGYVTAGARAWWDFLTSCAA